MDKAVDVVKSTAEELAKVKDMIETEVLEKVEEDIPTIKTTIKDTIKDLTSKAFDKLFKS